MTPDQQRIVDISEALHAAAKQVSILRNVAWPNEVEREFFANNAQKLPVVEYGTFDPSPILEAVGNARGLIGKADEIDSWASGIADKVESSARLLASRGTPEFFEHSKALFGHPSATLGDNETTPLDLALHFNRLFDHVKEFDIGEPPPTCVLPSTLADEMQKAVSAMFGDDGPEVVMDDAISSKAIAGKRRVAINPTASFSENDVQQLIEHEVGIHVVTALNGNAQQHVPILGYSHAGTTVTQEGLAVMAEFISGSIDLERAQRLSDRVLAAQMAIDGADFIDVYRYYLEITDDERKAFDAAKRVFRGGVVSGGAPFTKDIVYLEGLIRVQNFLSIVISSGKFEYIDLLFCGKLGLQEIPALKDMHDLGLIQPPKYLPSWIRDKRFLLTHMSFFSFLRDIDADKLHEHYEQLIL